MNSCKKIIALALVVITILTFSVISVSADETNLYGVVTADLLNIRAGNSTDTAILAQAPNGSYLKVYWVDETSWARVTYNGIEGYVAAQYITIHSGEMPSRSGAASTKGSAAVEIATKYLGVPYVYGGTSPNGFDCSGLVYYVYAQLGIKVNRVAADQMNNGVAVSSKADLLPGDIVGFYSSVGGSYVGHVGIYIGNGKMIHAPQTGDVVKVTDISTGSYANRYAGGRRVY